jgi:hypothetical protein
MKNNVVTTANGPVWEEDASGETTVERFDVAIDMVLVPALGLKLFRHHSTGSRGKGLLIAENLIDSPSEEGAKFCRRCAAALPARPEA